MAYITQFIIDSGEVIEVPFKLKMPTNIKITPKTNDRTNYVYDIIEKWPGISRNHLTHRNRSITNKELQAILDDLVASQLIVAIKNVGSKKTAFYPI